MNPEAFRFFERFTRDWSNPEEIARRLDGGVTLFQPWGFSYSEDTRVGEAASAALRKDALLATGLRLQGVETEFIIMPADAYACRINKWPRKLVNGYFENLRRAAKGVVEENKELNIRFKIKPWSRIVEENVSSYARIREAASQEVAVPEEAVTAASRSMYDPFAKNNGNPEVAARDYIIERLAEAQLIEQVYSPIKISLASPNKDVLDGKLPRVYLRDVKSFPWLKGGSSGT